MADEDRKIIVDEDWKQRVQREKEEAQQRSAEQTGASGAEETEAPAGDQQEQQAADADPHFMSLLGSLVTQTMFSLGMVPQEGQDKVGVDINQAKQLIDMLIMLRSKTQGNLTDDESGQLNEAIGELQRVYVMRAQQVQEAQMKQAGVDPNNLK